MSSARKWVFGLALLGATFGAGIGWANAQTDSTTPPTTEAAPHAPDHQQGDCPHREGASRDHDGTTAGSPAAFRVMRV